MFIVADYAALRMMEFSIKFDTVKSGWSNCIFLGVAGYNFKKIITFLSLKINFVSANIADPDEMSPYATFHQGLHCLS